VLEGGDVGVLAARSANEPGGLNRAARPGVDACAGIVSTRLALGLLVVDDDLGLAIDYAGGRVLLRALLGALGFRLVGLLPLACS